MLEAKYPFPLTSFLFGSAVTNVSETEISLNVDSVSYDLINHLKIGKLASNNSFFILRFEKYRVSKKSYFENNRFPGLQTDP